MHLLLFLVLKDLGTRFHSRYLKPPNLAETAGISELQLYLWELGFVILFFKNHWYSLEADMPSVFLEELAEVDGM